jgi:hypothetical protein
MRAIEAMLRLLLHTGFAPAEAADVASVLNVYGVGFMLDEALGPGPSSAPPSLPPYPRPTTDDDAIGGLSGARLLFERGAADVTIRADAGLPTLFQMTSVGRPPQVETRDGTLRVRQHHTRRSSCVLTLTGRLPWAIHIEGGAVRLTADLRAVQLSSLQVTGGVNQMAVLLAQPVAIVPVQIDGGVNKLRIERPSTAAMRLYVARASSHLMLDGVRLKAAGGGTDWASPDYTSASDRYNVELSSAGSDVTLVATTHEEAATASDAVHDHAQNVQAQMREWFAAQLPQAYPTLVALAGELSHPDQERRFELGLQLMLDGLERRLATASRPSPGHATSG